MEFILIVREISITKKMYGWSKYGGARKGLVKEELDEWSCQLCGSTNNRSLPAYFVPEDATQREYMRICSDCKHLALKHDLKTFDELLAGKLANLLTFPRRY